MIKHVRVIITVIYILSLVLPAAQSKVLDPLADGPERVLLEALAPELDRKDIDVVLGKSSGFPLSARPRVASLEGFKADVKDWGSFSRDDFALGFQDGIVGVLVAAKPSQLESKSKDCMVTTNEDEEGCKFIEDWLDADEDRRIFLAFTSKDFGAANDAKRALEDAGYVVFTFLKGVSERPWATPALVGELFVQAGHRLVLDTESARSSVGVALESKLCEYLLTGRPKPTRLSKYLHDGRV